MLYGRPPRAYAQIDGRWYYIYTIRFYTQVSLFGENVKMCSFYRSKTSKVIEDIAVEKLEIKKPVQRRGNKNNVENY